LNREWTCVELRRDYLTAAMGRFVRVNGHYVLVEPDQRGRKQQYTLFRPGGLWDNSEQIRLEKDGGKAHRVRRSKQKAQASEKPTGDAGGAAPSDAARPVQLRIKDV
jgi:hypothetical protein